ncbi:MAG: PHB depolymerase family esterase [Myxococcota bacterium]
MPVTVLLLAALGAPSNLQPVEDFGTNPGALAMHAYVPKATPPGAPLVVALHGCLQPADDYAQKSGWLALADELGFALLVPGQVKANNPAGCFSWFEPTDIQRGQGEASSIRQMVEYMVKTHRLDRARVFVTGLSAGGAMATAMLAAYPDVFSGGAIIAGLPYRCAEGLADARRCMGDPGAISPGHWGQRVRAASDHKGPWPTVQIWHGAADPIVSPANAEALAVQWQSVHGVAAAPEARTGKNTKRRQWRKGSRPVIEMVLVDEMGHGVPLAPNCGTAGDYLLDVGVCSTRQIAEFWGLAPQPK